MSKGAHSHAREWGLTRRSRRGPTAGHQARAGGTRTFSPARAWRPAVGPASPPTLGVGSYVTQAIEATSTKAEGRHGSALVRCVWDQITKPSASGRFAYSKIASGSRAFWFGSFHSISSFRSGHILWLVSQGRFAPPCSAPGSQLVVCAPPVFAVRPFAPEASDPAGAFARLGAQYAKPPPLGLPRLGRVRGTRADEVVKRKFQSGQLPKTPSRRGAAIPTPNPSVEARPNGKPPGPGHRYAVHFLWPGPGVLPSAPPHLQR